MQVLEPVYLEYRCNRCWNSNLGTIETVGSEAPCRYCGKQNTVPEATLENIERALDLLKSHPEILTPPDKIGAILTFDESSDRESGKLSKVDAGIPLERKNYLYYPDASIWLRFLGFLIDNLLLVLVAWVGLQAVIWLSTHGYSFENPINSIRRRAIPAPDVLLLLGVLPAALIAIQWILLSLSGQTLAKKLLMMRIVTDDGRVPGFIRCVALRNWVPFFITCIPVLGKFFPLVDALFLMFTSRKCIHDYLAGTRVISLLH